MTSATIDSTPMTTGLAQASLDFVRWPIRYVKQYRIALLTDDKEAIARGIIATSTPTERKGLLEGRLGTAVTWQAVTDEEFDELTEREESTRLIADSSFDDDDDSRAATDEGEHLSLESVEGAESPIVRAVNASLYDALRLGASDVHFETTQQGLQVRYRLDGVLVPGTQYNGRALAEKILSRIKVVAQLDIAERRIPQDGRFVSQANGRRIDFRVSIMPSAFGEDAVIRILDKQQVIQDLDSLSLAALGLSESDQEDLQRLANMPHGMLLVTGPTGSGKTTTLYALLHEVLTDREKLITIEDPIEYQLPGVLQIPVNERKGLTFAKGLRSILRHDPDRIMVGEIRDSETAEIAIQSALTGHTVFTTVHANNIFDVVGRFAHMAVDLSNFVTALNGVVAQRLIRLLCNDCAVSNENGTARVEASDVELTLGSNGQLRRPVGCQSCNFTGYRGRVAIAEMLVLDDEVRQCIRERAPVGVLKEQAKRLGVTSLRERALALAASGRTTLEECDRVSMAD